MLCCVKRPKSCSTQFFCNWPLWTDSISDYPCNLKPFLYQLVWNSVQGHGSSQGTNEQFMAPALLRFQMTAPCSTPLVQNDTKQEILIKKKLHPDNWEQRCYSTPSQFQGSRLGQSVMSTCSVLLRIAFCGSCLKQWTSWLALPLLAP